jgi:hypothetical protein
MTMTDLPVRLATRADKEGLLFLCRELHAENGLFPLAEARVADMLERAFNRDHALIGVIGEPGGELKGSIYLAMHQYWYTDSWFLDELWNYVHPAHRPPTEKGCAQALLEWAKKAADQMEMPLMVGIVSSHRTEAKIRLYERHFTKAGAFFIHNKELATAHVQ